MTVRTKHKGSKGGKRHDPKTITIATATFAIPSGKTTAVEVELNTAGRALLGAEHGHCSASLTILKLASSPENTQVKTVQLVEEKAHRRNRTSPGGLTRAVRKARKERLFPGNSPVGL